MLDYMSEFSAPSVDGAVKEVTQCFDTRDSLVSRAEIERLAREEIARANTLNCSAAGWAVYGLKTTVEGVAALARALEAERTFTLNVWIGAKLRRIGEARAEIAVHVMSFVPAGGLALAGAMAHLERGRPPRALPALPASLRTPRPPAPVVAANTAPPPARRTTAPKSTSGDCVRAHPPDPPPTPPPPRPPPPAPLPGPTTTSEAARTETPAEATNTETPAVAAPARPGAKPSRRPVTRRLTSAVSSAWTSVSSWGRSCKRADD